MVEGDVVLMPTVFQLTPHAAGRAMFTQIADPAQQVVQDSAWDLHDQLAFQLEKRFEEFLVHNWRSTVRGQEYDVYEEEGQIGQQQPTELQPMDILAMSYTCESGGSCPSPGTSGSQMTASNSTLRPRRAARMSAHRLGLLIWSPSGPCQVI
jgi:hypothetical protein